MEIYDEPFPLDETMCKDCAHRLSRILVPIDFDALGIDPEQYGFNEDSNEEFTMEQHICLVSNEDLETIVLKCTHYKSKNEVNLLGRNLF